MVRGLLYINNGEINTCIGRSRVYGRRFYGRLCGCGTRIRIPAGATTTSAMSSSSTICSAGDPTCYISNAKVTGSAKKENSEKNGDTNTTPNFPQQFAGIVFLRLCIDGRWLSARCPTIWAETHVFRNGCPAV